MLSKHSKNSIYWTFCYFIVSLIINYFLEVIFINILLIGLGIILLIVPYLKKDYFNKNLFYVLLVFFISINIIFLGIQINKPHEKQTAQMFNQFELNTDKITELETKCINSLENLSKFFQNFYCPNQTIRDNKICYSNVTFLNNGYAVLINNCDVMYSQPITINDPVISIIMQIKPLWNESDYGKHLILDLGKGNNKNNRVTLFVEEKNLQLSLSEEDGTEHIIKWGGENWDFNKSYILGFSINKNNGEIKLFKNSKEMTKKIDTDDFIFKIENATLYLGSSYKERNQLEGIIQFIGVNKFNPYMSIPFIPNANTTDQNFFIT